MKQEAESLAKNTRNVVTGFLDISDEMHMQRATTISDFEDAKNVLYEKCPLHNVGAKFLKVN